MKRKDYDVPGMDDQVIDESEISQIDIKINPDFYMHTTELKIQDALIKDNVTEGFMQFRLLAKHMETLARAAGRVPPDFDEQCEEFIQKPEYTQKKDDLSRGVAIAEFKLGLIYQLLFTSAKNTSPLKYKGGRV